MTDLPLPPVLGGRWQAYLDALAGVLGRPERQAGLRNYCTGLLLPGERKSIEPIAARLGAERQSARHQALHHFVTQARWSDEALLDAVAGQVLPVLEQHGPITAWILDDTGIPKRGAHSVGVAVQDCGVRRQTANCQVAVSLSLANAHASLPVAFRLYLPEAWAHDRARRGWSMCRWGCASRPSMRSRSTRSAPRWPRGCRAASCWPMAPTAPPSRCATPYGNSA